MEEKKEHDHTKCLTGCAHTYREAREAQKKEKQHNEQVVEEKR